MINRKDKMSYELTGQIKQIGDVQTFASGFQKKEFVVTTTERFPQDVKFEAVKDRVDMLDNFQVGDMVTVGFDIRGNEFNGRHYVNLNCWKLNAAGTNSAPIDDGPIEPPPSGDDGDCPF